MHSVVVLLSLFAIRGISVGDSCIQVAKMEASTVAQPVLKVAHMLEMNLLVYDYTESNGQPSRVMYDCSTDTGTVGQITIVNHAGEISQARGLFEVIKKELAAELGAPDFDSDSLTSAQQERIRYLTAKLMLAGVQASWNLDNQTRLQVFIAKDMPGETWHVTTTLGPAPVKPQVAGDSLDISGTWHIQARGTRCVETWTIRPDGTRHSQSDKEELDSTYTISKSPSEGGAYLFVDRVIRSNGLPDCQGSITPVGDVARAYLFPDGAGRYELCLNSGRKDCSGVLSR